MAPVVLPRLRHVSIKIHGLPEQLGFEVLVRDELDVPLQRGDLRPLWDLLHGGPGLTLVQSLLPSLDTMLIWRII